MSDALNDKNELDSYGVWVKRPPTSVSDNKTDDFNFDADIPNFSETDDAAAFNDKIADDATLTTEELTNITDDIQSEEVALDEFLDDDFSFGDDAKKTEDVPPLDIDLSFDAPPQQAAPQPAEDIAFDIPSFDEPADSSEAIDAAALNEIDSPVITDENFDDIFDELPDETFMPSDERSDSVSTPDAMEDIDVADFGFDANAEETPATSNGSEAPTREIVDYDLSVAADDAPSYESNIVPDSFDEETKSLMDNASDSTHASDSELLQQIVADLSGLKNEIEGLKNEFAELKSRGGIAASSTETKGGFFSDMDEDETISLSGDELDNIMNTADFSSNDAASDLNIVPDSSGMSDTTLPADDIFGSIDVSESPTVDENAASNLTMDFDKNLVEPDLEEFEADAADEIPEELPEEIAIPRADDIVVGPSQSDFMDSVKDTTEIAIPSVTEIVPDNADADTLEDIPEDMASVDDFLKPEPTIAESLTQDNLDYLNTDEAAKKELKNESTADISSELKEEVKSVLLYMDQLLESLPEEKIVEFARSEQFATYKKLFTELGLT
ncbi:MAG: hypothetical protein IJR50_00545 [Treponema sp.]|nr:hypothetical protein [Treponema sp.]